MLNTIEDLYYEENYIRVIELSSQLLENPKKLDNGVLWELHYWRCLAFSWLKKSDEFFESLDYFKTSADKSFLLGFYFRKIGDYDRAESNLISALGKSPNFKRAKRELVNVYLSKGEYDKALNIAQENYHANPANPYHIQAYFICLIRNSIRRTKERPTIEELITAISSTSNPKSESIATIMKAEFAFYIEQDYVNSFQKLTEALEQGVGGHKRYAYFSLEEMYKSRGFIDQLRQLRKKYNSGRGFRDDM